VEAAAALKAAAEMDGPCYLRFGRYAVPVIHDVDFKFEIGKGEVLVEGNDVTVVATGMMVAEALKAAETLKEQGVSARVINIHTIKPLDTELILRAAAETGAIVTAEEHNIIGGLGSAVAECVGEACPVPVVRVGVRDTFGRSGKVPPLLEMYGLTAKEIVCAAEKALKLKK
jgi:transketolase